MENMDTDSFNTESFISMDQLYTDANQRILPAHLGAGFLYTTELRDNGMLSYCEITPHQVLQIKEHSYSPQYTLVFNLEDEYEWINNDSKASCQLSHRHFCLLQPQAGELTNIYFAQCKYAQYGIAIDDQRYESLLEYLKVPSFIHNELKQTSTDHFISVQSEHILKDMLHCPYRGELRNHYIEAKITELLVILGHELMDKEGTESIPLSRTDQDGLRAVKQILEEQFISSPPITELVRSAMMNEFKLKQAFKQMFGCSIHAYTIKRRMQEAKQLLESGQYNVMQAASMVGYSNSSYFISKFRQTYGYNPSQLKK